MSLQLTYDELRQCYYVGCSPALAAYVIASLICQRGNLNPTLASGIECPLMLSVMPLARYAPN